MHGDTAPSILNQDNWATLFLGDMNTGSWPSRLEESQELEQQNMVLSPAGLRPERDCAGEAKQ
jgi:hypothetical protein